MGARRRLLPVIFSAFFLAACSGGGGGGGAGGTGDGPSPPSPDDSAPRSLALDSSNVLDAATAAIRLSELVQLLAGEVRGLLELEEQNGFGVLTTDCLGGPGGVTSTYHDADDDGRVSLGDTMVANYVACPTLSGSLTLTIEEAIRTGEILDRVTGVVDINVTLNVSPVPLAGTARLTGRESATISVDPIHVGWESSAARLELTYQSRTLAIENAAIDLSVSDPDQRYRVEFNGDVEIPAGRGAFQTVTPIEGVLGSLPFGGVVRISGGGSSQAELSAQTALGVDTSQVDVRIDGDGDGRFETTSVAEWARLFAGPLLGVSVPHDSGWPVGQSPVPDVLSRRFDVGGDVRDAVADAARNRVYLSIPERNEIAVIDGASLAVLNRIYAGSEPYGLALSADGTTLYAALHSSGAVAAIDLDTLSRREIPVAAALGTPFVSDVIEASPGIVYVMGKQVSGTPRLARIDMAVGDAVSQSASTLSFDNDPEFIGVHGGFLYAWGIGFGGVILKVDLATGAVVASSGDDPTLRTYGMSLSRDGSRIYTGGHDTTEPGPVLSTTDLASLGTAPVGLPVPFESGTEVMMASFVLRIVSADTFALIDELTYDCGDGFTSPSRVVPLARAGQWLLVSGERYCALDLDAPRSPPGENVEVPREEVPTTSVVVRQTRLADVGLDLELDAARNRWIVSEPLTGGIEFLSTADLAAVKRLAFPGSPRGLALSPTQRELAIAFNDTGEVGFLDLETNLLERADIGAALDSLNAHDVAWWQDSVFVASRDYLAKVEHAPPHDAIRVSNVSLFDESPELLVDAAGQALYVGRGTKFPALYHFDLSQPDLPDYSSLEAIEGTRSLSVSADGKLLALSSGQIVRSRDFTLAAAVEPGLAVFSADGRSLVVATDTGALHVYDAATFRKTRIVTTDCAVHAASKLVERPAGDEWALLGDATLCSIPLASDSAPQTTSKPSAQPYFCGIDCMTRKYVLRNTRDPAALAVALEGLMQ